MRTLRAVSGSNVLRQFKRLFSKVPSSSRPSTTLTGESCLARSAAAKSEKDYFRYTSGRWLWNEEEQLKERYRKFNVAELKTVISRLLGSSKCVNTSKIGEGNYNKVFRFTMEDSSVAIARIPHPNFGPSHYTTASEVATMEFARSVLQIPVPKVLAWCSTSENPVGSEYIIMEEAKGTQLTTLWEGLDLDEKRSIIYDIVNLEKKLLSTSFNFFGSLYFAGDSFPGCRSAEIAGDVEQAVKEDVKRRFVIGPTSLREFWKDERSQLEIDRGPWKSAIDYVKAVAVREISWISKYASSSATVPGYIKLSDAQLSPREHIRLLQMYIDSVLSLIPQDPDLVRPVLWHPDIHNGNLFVEQGKITSVINWQSIWVGPLILQARTPRLIDYNGEILLKLPENFKDLGNDEKDTIRDQVSRSLQVYTYEYQTAKENPLLNRAMRQPFGKRLSELVCFAGDSWDDDILPLRECLINIERDWSKLGINHPCPYHFSHDEILQHRKDGEGFNETQEFWDTLEGLVDRSGWTSHENFDAAVNYFSELREAGLGTLVGEEREEFARQTRWVLDHTSSGK